MGNASCSRRMQQNPVFTAPPGYPNSHATPLGQLPYYHQAGGDGNIPPDVSRQQPFSQGFMPTNGQFFMNMPAGSLGPMLPPEALFASNLSPPVTEHKVVPIRNEVNVNKSTLHLEQDAENPGFYLVAFTFDATVSGSFCICFLGKEGRDFSIIPMKRDKFEPVQITFEKGLSQKFVQAPGTGVKLSAFEPSDLLQVTDGEIYPLVVRAETCGGGDSSMCVAPKEAGAPLLKSVGAQATSCVLEAKGNDEYGVKVIKQIIWVEGLRYELQEIYGIESVDGGGGGGSGGIDSGDLGKECVICLSEQRDTTVLPCRHMCMCSGCAKVLQQRTNRCPVCRTPIAKLLEIEIPTA